MQELRRSRRRPAAGGCRGGHRAADRRARHGADLRAGGRLWRRHRCPHRGRRDQGRAREFLPLPPEPELIAAILAAVGDERRELVSEDPAMSELLAMARQIAPVGRQRADHRRERHRQGDGRALRASPQPPRGTAVRLRQLRGHPGEPAGIRAVRAREGRLHRGDRAGGSASSRRRAAARCCSTRSARWTRACRPSCCARSRSARSTGSAARRPVKVDIRLIATSNRDLEAEVAAGRFREDLLFRLNVVNLHLPPLRDRPADLAPLGAALRPKYRRANGLPERPLSEAALDPARGASLAGNVRELENCIHRAVLLARGDEIEARGDPAGAGRANGPRARASWRRRRPRWSGAPSPRSSAT